VGSSRAASETTFSGHIGRLLRHWRTTRRIAQLALAVQAEVSARHLSYIEQGRALPSREMILRLAEGLQIPLRERNTLLLAAGYATTFGTAQDITLQELRIECFFPADETTRTAITRLKEREF
jgi:transcriptional regulator with XRE-family HTH domain